MPSSLVWLLLSSSISALAMSDRSATLDVSMDRDIIDRLIGILVLARMESDVQYG